MDDLADLPRTEWPEDPADRYRFAIDLDRGRNHSAHHLAHVLHHLATAWERRDLPNVHLFHYADLQRDLPGEVVRLGAALGMEVTSERAEELAEGASLERMRARAAQHTPDAATGVFVDPARFFRTGGSGEWREWLRPGDEEHYAARVAELVEPDLAHWAHHGRSL